MKYLPKLNEWRNELVAWLGIAASIIAGVSVALTDTNVDSLESLLALVPAVLGVVQRNLAYGPETVKDIATNNTP